MSVKTKETKRPSREEIRLAREVLTAWGKNRGPITLQGLSALSWARRILKADAKAREEAKSAKRILK